MANNSLVTSITHSNADVMTGKQKPYWVEFQLVDEQNEPVANMPWTVESTHPVSGPVEGFTYSGQSDADGLIRVDMPHGLELRLTLDGNQLATEMEKRALRVSAMRKMILLCVLRLKRKGISGIMPLSVNFVRVHQTWN